MVLVLVLWTRRTRLATRPIRGKRVLAQPMRGSISMPGAKKSDEGQRSMSVSLPSSSTVVNLAITSM